TAVLLVALSGVPAPLELPGQPGAWLLELHWPPDMIDAFTISGAVTSTGEVRVGDAPGSRITEPMGEITQLGRAVSANTREPWAPVPCPVKEYAPDAWLTLERRNADGAAERKTIAWCADTGIAHSEHGRPDGQRTLIASATSVLQRAARHY